MEIITTLFQVIYECLLAIPKVVLSIFPMYNALADFQQNLIAAALGVSPAIVWIVFKIIKLIKKALFC